MAHPPSPQPCIHRPVNAQSPGEAHLVIHSALNTNGSHVASALNWLRSLYARRDTTCARPCSLQITDLHGHVVFASDEMRDLVDVALPAGTYHVRAQYGLLQRSYTLKLAQGRSFELSLNLATKKR